MIALEGFDRYILDVVKGESWHIGTWTRQSTINSINLIHSHYPGYAKCLILEAEKYRMLEMSVCYFPSVYCTSMLYLRSHRKHRGMWQGLLQGT